MTVRPLRRPEAREAVALAARAFHEDPLYRHLYPDPRSAARRFSREYRAVLRHVYFPLGRADAIDVGGELAGVALWKPDGAHVPWWREMLVYPSFVRAVGLRQLAVALDAYAAFDAALPDGQYHYLGLIAVAPEAQGRGIGSALLRDGLARADADGLGCFLETGTQENVRFYERHGFAVWGEIEIPDGPLHWGMWREPSAEG